MKTRWKIGSFLVACSFILSQLLSSFVPFAYAATSPWSQTNWAGGSGQTSWSDTTKYSSSSDVVTSTASQVTLTANSEKFTNTDFETNLTDWNTGALPNTVSGLQLWLKADAITGLSDGAAVATWEDSSTSEVNLTQSTAGDRPTYQANELNSLPIVRFDGSSDYLMNTSISWSLSGGTYFFVTKRTAALTTDSGVFSLATTSGSDWNSSDGLTINSSVRAERLVGADQLSLGPTALSLDTFEILALELDGGTATFYKNGASIGSDGYSDTSTIDPNRIAIGSRLVSSPSKFYPLDLAEHLTYSTALSGSDRQAVIAYLQGKYGISSGYATLTRDTTTTYGGSAGSAKLVNGSNATSFNQYVNVGDTNTYNLSAYAHTDGSAVTSSDVELFYNGSTVSTTYTSVGSGWYKLTGTLIGANASRVYGVQVKASKTVYLDNFSLNSYASSGTLASSIFDTESSSGAAWGTLTYSATTPTNTSATVKVRTSNSSSMTGATDFSSCSAVTSGADISSNSCVTDGHRYIQYFLTLGNTSTEVTPTFTSISTTFSVFDSAGPTGLEIQSPGNNSYINNTRPTFKWLAATDALSSVAGYSLSVNNGSSGGFSIGGIPASGTTNITSNPGYTIHFDGFNDGNSSNDYISVWTNSSSTWGSEQNNGALNEGNMSSTQFLGLRFQMTFTNI